MKETLLSGYYKINPSNADGQESKIGIKTIIDRNKEVPWKDFGAVPVGKFLVVARQIEIDENHDYRWQYGLLCPDDSIKKSPAIYKSEEEAIKDGIDLAKKEIQSWQEE